MQIKRAEMENERTEARHDYSTRDDDDNASNLTTEANGGKAKADNLTTEEKDSKAKADNLTTEEKGGNARADDLATEAGDNKTKTEENRNRSETATREGTIAITTKKTTMITGQG